MIVIGGGDTGNDCLGTSLRHGAKSIVNFELLPQPPNERAKGNPWPQFPRVFKVDYGHTEVAAQWGSDPREYCISTTSFEKDADGKLVALNTIKVNWELERFWKVADEQDPWLREALAMRPVPALAGLPGS